MARKKKDACKERTPNPNPREWAFLVYIGGDNNLSDAGLEDIDELCQVGASDKVHVGVELDTYGELTGSIRYGITEPDWNGQAHRVVLERLSEKDHGDPETLTDFLKWGFREFTAKNHLVVVWNHGSGFRMPHRDISYDDFGSSLDMPEVESALINAGVGPNKKIRVVGFDACLMSMLEIAHHFKDYADIIVGSEETEPWDGWPYDEVLNAIKVCSDTKDLAKRIVDVYIDSYKKIGISNVTQSAVSLAETEDAVKALSDLGNKLKELLAQRRGDLKNIRLRLQSFAMADYVDVIHMASVIGEEINEAKPQADALINATKACIIASGSYGDAVKNAQGLSIWFPGAEYLYLNYRAKYLALKCNQTHDGWVSFLDAFFS